MTETTNSVAQTRTNVQRPEDFLNRKRELGQLNDRIFDRAFRFLCIWGAGGIGKTWLAREFGYHAAARNTFHAVVWTTAKEKELVARSPILGDALRRPPRIRQERSTANRDGDLIQSLDKLYAAIAIHSGHPDARDSSQISYISREDILAWLRIRKILLIMDDLDAWGDKWADVVNFAEAIRPPSVVLLTSRMSLNDKTLPSVSTISLGPLDDPNANSLLRQYAQKRHIRFDPSEYRRILDFAEGNPLVLKLAVGVIPKRTRLPGEVEALLKSAGRDTTMTRFLYEMVYSGLTAQAQRLAMYYAITHDEKLTELTENRVAEICEIRGIPVRGVIEELSSVSLIDGDPGAQNEHDMHPLAVAFVINRDPELHRRLQERIQALSR